MFDPFKYLEEDRRVWGITSEAAFNIHEPTKPWYVRLEYVDHVSDKFWEAWGESMRDNEVYVRWGRNRTPGQGVTKDMAYVRTNLPKKLAKGYQFVQATLVGRGPVTFSVPWDLKPHEKVEAPLKLAVPKGYKEKPWEGPTMRRPRRTGSATSPRKGGAAEAFAKGPQPKPTGAPPRFSIEMEVEESVAETIKKNLAAMQEETKRLLERESKPEKPSLKELIKKRQKESEW